MKTKQKQQSQYPVALRYSAEDEAWIAEVYDLPGCMADGPTPDKAIKAAFEAAELWLEVAKEKGRDIPPPSSETAVSGKFVVRMPKSLHYRLQLLAKVEDVSLNQLVITLLAQREAEQRASR